VTILIDMNLSTQWVRFLQDHGVESVHWSTVGPGNAPDPKIMDYASTQGFSVLTRDLDFGSLLKTHNHSRPSVIQIRDQIADPASIGQHVVLAILEMKSQIERGALVTIDASKTRMRLLPMFPPNGT